MTDELLHVCQPRECNVKGPAFTFRLILEMLAPRKWLVYSVMQTATYRGTFCLG